MHETVVVPKLKLEPEAGVATTPPTPGQLSLAVTWKLTTDVHASCAFVTTMSAGQESAGGSASKTVTLNVHCAELPAASKAVHVTGVTPTGKNESEAGTQTIFVMGEQVSLACGKA